MRSYLLLVVFFTGFFTAGFAQDRIITYNNDTLDCEIIRVTLSNIFYSTPDESIRSTNRIPLSEVLKFTVSAVKGSTARYNPFLSDRYPRLRLGLSGGAGCNLSRTEEQVEELVQSGMEQRLAESYIANIKSGFLVNADILWLINSKVGTGAKYRFFGSTSAIDGFVGQYTGPVIIYMTLKERVYVNFIGIEFLYRRPLDNQRRFYGYCNGSFGPVTYRKEREYYYYHGNSIETGKTFGMEGTAGFEFFINPQMSVGAELSVFNAVIKRVLATDGIYTLTIDLPEDRYKKLSRIDLSLGIKFYLWEK